LPASTVSSQDTSAHLQPHSRVYHQKNLRVPKFIPRLYAQDRYVG
jgi:hypothetical protein